jgi:nitrogen-specific signal transduction histidine kinase
VANVPPEFPSKVLSADGRPACAWTARDFGESGVIGDPLLDVNWRDQSAAWARAGGFSDTGTGIPDNIRDRIFDSFLSGRPGGTGLGLAIAKRVLNSHYGDLTLVTSSPAGTTMRLTLPLA